MANNQSVRRHLDAFTRGRIIGKLEEGRSVTSVVAEFGIAHSIVSRLWRQFQTTGTAIRGFSSGRPRGTTPADDRYIVLQARRNRRLTAGEIARHTTQATGRPISRFTVTRRPYGGGLFARRPVRCVPLTPAHRRRHESRFSLSSDSHRILIWRERGSRNHPSNIIERDRYGGRGVLVWGGIMLGSRTDLHIFDAGWVNGTRYCNEILLPYVRLFRGAMGLQFLFMDDNAPCHRTVAAEQLLESEDIERMDWPTRSPDLNPIEHVWDFLGRRLAARTLPPVTIRDLRLALQGEWAAMPQQLIDTLILSMGRRCETCLAVRKYDESRLVDHARFNDGTRNASHNDEIIDGESIPIYFLIVLKIFIYEMVCLEEIAAIANPLKTAPASTVQLLHKIVNGEPYSPAKTFLQTLHNILTYSSLKAALIEEFEDLFCSYDVHKEMQKRKLRSTESLFEYFLAMREIASKAHFRLDD
ncbi:transposable element Tcb2 transposase [Trichonephila clavipes]|nr:transposable element Tcb2 transposase [Trichonephila clavipes]